MGASRREAAEWFEVSPSSAIKWMQRRRATGSIAAKPSGGGISPLEERDAKGRYQPDREAAEEPDRRKGKTMTRISPAKDPTRNVWLQLGLPDAEEHYLKAELVLRLYNAIKALGVTQRTAARRANDAARAIEDFRGKFSEVSLERLMRFLTALGCQIEIKIRAGTHKKAGKVVVTDVGRRAV